MTLTFDLLTLKVCGSAVSQQSLLQQYDDTIRFLRYCSRKCWINTIHTYIQYIYCTTHNNCIEIVTEN